MFAGRSLVFLGIANKEPVTSGSRSSTLIIINPCFLHFPCFSFRFDFSLAVIHYLSTEVPTGTE